MITNGSAEYRKFLERKRRLAKPSGFTVTAESINPKLFPFQRDIVRWALRLGKAAIFLDTGLGKTGVQLTWADQVHQRTGGNVLLLAPLAVGRQTLSESVKFGINSNVSVADSQEGVRPGITITNYEKLHRFDANEFSAVVLDESSIIKNCDGKTRTKILTAFAHTPYRLACTATPAPNDQMELGNHAEFVGVMSRSEMLSMFFVHDGGDTSKWRLKGHAETEFWKWMASWSVAIRKPSDIGYADDGYNLPPMTIHEHVVEDAEADEGFLFSMDAKTLHEQRASRRRTIQQRAEIIASMANSGDDAWVVWCNLNDESKAGAAAILDSVEVCGADSDKAKEEKLLDFSEGRKKRIVTKPSVAGFGLNWQHAHKVGFLGVSHSWEQWKQSIARCYRFGQKKKVEVHVAIGDRELQVLDNVRRKGAEADSMAQGMIEHMQEISRAEIKGVEHQTTKYEPTAAMKIPVWCK